MSDSDQAASYAIFAAKQHGSNEVQPDHLLIGCLRAISRFGIATVGNWNIDLEPLGVDWVRPLEGPRPKVAYAQETVDLFDRAAMVARSTGESKVGVHHLLAAFAGEERGLMGELKTAHGITSATWRAQLALRIAQDVDAVEAPAHAGETKPGREYLTPEEAAEALGVHVQTMRAYIRSGRLPAFRVAGERAIRVLRNDLEKVLEPLGGLKKEE